MWASGLRETPGIRMWCATLDLCGEGGEHLFFNPQAQVRIRRGSNAPPSPRARRRAAMQKRRLGQGTYRTLGVDGSGNELREKKNVTRRRFVPGGEKKKKFFLSGGNRCCRRLETHQVDC